MPRSFYNNPEDAIEACERSSRTTHASTQAVDACRYYGGLIWAAVNGVDKETLLKPHYHPAKGEWSEDDLDPEVYGVADYLEFAPTGDGYVIESMGAALWAFATTDNYVDGLLAVVNLGDDADTTGAIYGMLAGAYYGVEDIPTEWVEKLAFSEYIGELDNVND